MLQDNLLSSASSSPLDTKNTGSIGVTSPLAGPTERSAYDMLMAMARGDTPAGGDGAPAGPGPGAPQGAPSTGNFGQDLASFGRAAGPVGLGMMANPASLMTNVPATMAAIGINAMTGMPAKSLGSVFGMRGLANQISQVPTALYNSLVGYPQKAEPATYGGLKDDWGKPDALSPEEAAALGAALGISKSDTMANYGWGGADGSGQSSGDSAGGQAGGEQGGAGVGGGGGMSGVGGGTGASSSGSQDSGGASGANLASGGLVPFAEGGHIVTGPGGGLDDLIPTTIGGRKAAALSDGEFVIPADVVSMMGDGSTGAGARRLYDFMNSIRKHKTGSTEQAGPLPIGDILKRSMQ